MKKTKTQPINSADVASTPSAGARSQQGKDSTDCCDSLGKRPPTSNAANAQERAVQKLHETKRRQFTKGNTN